MTSSVYIILEKCPERCMQDQFPFPSPLFSPYSAHGQKPMSRTDVQQLVCQEWVQGRKFPLQGSPGQPHKIWTMGSWQHLCLQRQHVFQVAEQPRWGAALCLLPQHVTTPSDVPTVGLLFSFPGTLIHRNSLGVSEVPLCLRSGTSYSTYSSQNLLHLHNYEQRSHGYGPASYYSSWTPALPSPGTC